MVSSSVSLGAEVDPEAGVEPDGFDVSSGAVSSPSLVASLDGFGSPWSGAFETDSFAPELGDSEPGSLLGAGAEGVAPSFSAALSTIDPLWSRTPPDGKRAADSGLRARVIGSVSAALSESS